MTGCLCRHVYWMWQAQTPDSQSLVVGCVFSAATRVLFITQCQVTNTGYQSGLFLLLLGQHLLPSMTLQNYYSRSPWGFYGVSPNFFKSAENYFTGYLFFFFFSKRVKRRCWRWGPVWTSGCEMPQHSQLEGHRRCAGLPAGNCVCWGRGPGGTGRSRRTWSVLTCHRYLALWGLFSLPRAHLHCGLC